MFRLPFGLDHPLLGIDISDASVEVVVLEQQQGPHLRSSARLELPPGIVVRGAIQEPKKLVDALRAVRMQLEKEGVRTVDAVFALPEEYTYTRRVVLQKKTGVAWRSQAATAVAESVPYALADVVWDALLLATHEESWTALCFAAPRSIVAAYEHVLSSAGFRPHLAASNAVALAQAFFPTGVPAPTLVLDIGTTTTILSLFDAQGMYASTIVAVGGQTLTQAIATQRGSSLEEAEEKKREAGFLPDAEQGAVFLLLQKNIQPLVQEAEAFMAEYTERLGAAPTQLVLAGGTALIPGIAAYLSAVLDLTIVSDARATALVAKTFSETQTVSWKKTASLYTVAIGLALYGFLPKEKHFSLGSGTPMDDGGASAEQSGVMQNIASVLPTSTVFFRSLLQRNGILLLASLGVIALLFGVLWYKGVFPSALHGGVGAPTSASVERAVTFPVIVSFTTTSSVPHALVGNVYDAEAVGEQLVSLLDVHAGKSTGTIRIQNTAAQERVLPAALLIHNASGTRFIIRDAVTVAARSTSKPLAIQAEKEGEEGDVGPQVFTIVDTAIVPQTGLRISNTASLTGGAPRGTVSSTAIGDAKQTLLATLFNKALLDLKQKKEPTSLFPSNVLERIVMSSSSPVLGSVVVREAVVQARVRVRTVSVTEEQLLAVIRADTAGLLGVASAAQSYIFSGWELGAGTIDALNGTAVISVTVQVSPAS